MTKSALRNTSTNFSTATMLNCLDMESPVVFNQRLMRPSFPSTRFYGSKRKQLQWLAEEFSHLKAETALDAYGGTGAVSFLMNSLGWKTTYNDIFDFNLVSARAIFSDSTKNFQKHELCDFLLNVKPKVGFISETFRDIYFNEEENHWLDGLMDSLKDMEKITKDLLLYLTFQACLKKRPFNLFHRANLHLRTSEMPVKFGNRTTWNKSFLNHMTSTYDELQKSQTDEVCKIIVNNPTCAKKLIGDYDVIYIDPPYFKLNKRNTDTYLQRYHFLEGLARFEEWPNLIDKKSPQSIIAGPYRDELTNKYQLLDDLTVLFSNNKNSKFILSYVSGEEPSEEEFFELFKNRFDKVKFSRRSFNKALSKKSSFEILFIGQ